MPHKSIKYYLHNKCMSTKIRQSDDTNELVSIDLFVKTPVTQIKTYDLCQKF